MPTAETYGRIDPEWAARLDNITGQMGIWTHNHSRTEEIGRDIHLQELGGLTVRFTDDKYSREQAWEIDRRRTVVVLAFGGEHGRLTQSNWLHDAAVQRGGEEDQLAVDLRKHSIRLGQPAWLIPLSAIEVVDLVEQSRT